VFLALLVAGIFALNGVASGQTVVADELKGNWISILGQSPATNLPGAVWQLATGWDYNQALFPDIESGGARWSAWSGTAVGLSIASSGNYTKPGALTIKADILINAASTGEAPWAALGFYDTLEVSNGSVLSSKTNFTGVLLNYDGSLSLYNDGVMVPGSTVAFGGSFSRGTYYTLSYTVDTSTGQISGVSLSGSSADYAPLMASAAPFTNAKTNYVGFGGAADSYPDHGGIHVKNFSLVAADYLPESGTLIRLSGLSGLGLIFVCCVGRKKGARSIRLSKTESNRSSL